MVGLIGLFLCVARALTAQVLPDAPVVLGDGRVTVGGDLSLTASCSHAPGAAACTSDTGFFNYSDYDHSTLRMVRVGLSTSVRITRQLTALGDVRLENAETPRPYGLYLRFRPFDAHDLDIQAGRIPSAFGAFSRRAYSADNPLISYPLAYQYLVSLRADALPASPDDLVRMRGRGWLSSFALGNQTPAAGVPLAEAFRWDTGVQAHGSIAWLDAAASWTKGSLSNPLFHDDNGGSQVAGRIALKPVAGLIVGASASRAPFATRAAAAAAHVADTDLMQDVVGVDAEYSRDHYLLRMEAVSSVYHVPTVASPLRATGTMVEGRYKLTPRTHLAARIDHLAFSTITTPTRTITWDAPVLRWEAGAGYALQRNLQWRVSFQRNTRDGGRVRTMTALATQLLYWF
jgi:hypothetical protein